MSVLALHESEATELDLPGRRLRWMVANGALKAKYCSSCIIEVAPGERVGPAHSHPDGEEVIYIVQGSGRVFVAGEVTAVKPGTMVLYPQGAAHMLHNTSAEEMKAVCFFAPPTGLENYRMHEGVDFPD
jgi:quercetin dioxygenase-like cupin family protein